jgi:hypothetical protein
VEIPRKVTETSPLICCATNKTFSHAAPEIKNYSGIAAYFIGDKGSLKKIP